MSHDVIIETALKRKEAFNNLPKHLQTIKKTVRKLDLEAEIYLFGSAGDKEHNYSSDIDILVITNLYPARIHAELWKAGIKEPFEIHVHTREEAEFFTRTTKLTQI